MVTRHNRPEMDALGTQEELRRLLAESALEVEELRTRVRDLEGRGVQFLSSASHAVMNPLTIIQSYLEIVLSDLTGGLSDEQVQFIKTARTASLRLHRLIENLVELAALEMGAADIVLDAVAVGDVVTEVCASHAPSAATGGVELAVTVESDLPRVRADANRMKDTLDAVVSNAVQWTPRGGRVQVTIALHDGDVVVGVADTGPGIQECHLEQVFDAFVRLPRANGEPPRGAGLSLSIARRRMDAMGGSLEVSSTLGTGSLFELRIPALSEDL